MCSRLSFSRLLVLTAVTAGGLSWITGYAQTAEKAPGATMSSAAPPAPTTPSSSRPPGTSAPPKRPPPAPDPGLFDGSGYPPEERPERGLLADFEAGEHEPSAGDPEGEKKPGGGGQEQDPASGITLTTPALAQSGQAAQQGGEENGGGGGGDAQDGSGGGSEGQQGEPGQSATPIAASADQQPVKPGEVALGDPNARIAQAPDARQVQGNSSMTNEQGEDRMSVKAASGQQSSPNRSRGSERGVDIPSNL